MRKLTWEDRAWTVVVFFTALPSAVKHYIKIVKETVQEGK